MKVESKIRLFKESTYSRYADTDEQEKAIINLERTLKSLGKKVVGGTKIGKHPQTVVLDLTYQGSQIHVSADTDYHPTLVRINGEDIYNPSNKDEVRAAIEDMEESLKKKRTESIEDPESQILSPEMSAVYNNKGSVPLQMQLLRKAIAEETKSISDYEGFISSNEFDPEDRSIIQEIADDEKDHIVKWTRLLDKYTKKSYPDFGNESVERNSNKLKLF